MSTYINVISNQAFWWPTQFDVNNGATDDVYGKVQAV